MELIPGDTLQSLVASRGPFSAEDASIIGAEICRGLAAIHQAGVIHRDIKAQNVMREQNGRVVVMDFSVSRNDDVERPGLAGTPLYLAPELFAGAPASVSSDVYSVGVLLYYLVTGQYPASASTIADVARIHAERRSVGLRDVRATCLRVLPRQSIGRSSPIRRLDLRQQANSRRHCSAALASQGGVISSGPLRSWPCLLRARSGSGHRRRVCQPSPRHPKHDVGSCWRLSRTERTTAHSMVYSITRSSANSAARSSFGSRRVHASTTC